MVVFVAIIPVMIDSDTAVIILSRTCSDSSGEIKLIDFSQQNLLSGTLASNEAILRGAEPNKQIIKKNIKIEQ